MSFVTQVKDVKQINNNNYILVDGSYFNVKPSKHKHNQPHKFFRAQERTEEELYKVCGYTCIEGDLLLNNIFENIVRRGDYLKIDNIGAYSFVMCPPFITTDPPIILQAEGVYKEVRHRQDFSGFFSHYEF